MHFPCIHQSSSALWKSQINTSKRNKHNETAALCLVFYLYALCRNSCCPFFGPKRLLVALTWRVKSSIHLSPFSLSHYKFISAWPAAVFRKIEVFSSSASSSFISNFHYLLLSLVYVISPEKSLNLTRRLLSKNTIPIAVVDCKFNLA